MTTTTRQCGCAWWRAHHPRYVHRVSAVFIRAAGLAPKVSAGFPRRCRIFLNVLRSIGSFCAFRIFSQAISRNVVAPGCPPYTLRAVYKTRESNPQKVADFKAALVAGDITWGDTPKNVSREGYGSRHRSAGKFSSFEIFKTGTEAHLSLRLGLRTN